MRYSIQPRTAEGINAGTKAVKDVSEILNNEGYRPFYVGSNYNGNHLYRFYILVYDLCRLLIEAKKEDIFFIQWPYYNYLMLFFYLVVKCKCRKIQILAHDINSLRNERHSFWDFKFFRMAQLIIVHSEAMKKYLVQEGIETKVIRILTCFDYLTEDKIEKTRNKSKEIVYAGNLKKSKFLKQIQDKSLNLNINCYGKRCGKLGKGLTYKGSFKPEKVSMLDGGWGLVWDGDSLDGCVGEFGNYLQYNAPHKLSLYIVSELPIIIWNKSAMAEYVEKKGLGFTISSIREIHDKINNISEVEYQNMLIKVKKEAITLRTGGHLKKCLN